MSFLRHPFHKPDPKPVADIRKRVCLSGPCPPCPAGQVRTAGGCGGGGGIVIQNRGNGYCSNSQIWIGGACLLWTRLLDDCSGLRFALERQMQQMQAAESIRENACTSGAVAECSSATANFESEQRLYKSLLNRYQQCQMQHGRTYSFSGFGYGRFGYGAYGYGAYGSDPLFDPLDVEVTY